MTDRVQRTRRPYTVHCLRREHFFEQYTNISHPPRMRNVCRKEHFGGNLLEADPCQAAYRPCQRCVIFGKLRVPVGEPEQHIKGFFCDLSLLVHLNFRRINHAQIQPSFSTSQSKS